MSIKAVLFDHDGTLVDSEGIHCQIWQTVLSRYNIVLPSHEYEKKFVGLQSIDIARQLARNDDCPVTADVLFTQKKQLVNEYLADNAFPLIKDVLAVMQSLKQAGITMAIVTGASRASVRSSVKAYGLAQYVDVVVSSDDVINNKPAPDPYLLAVKQLGLQVNDCVAVEDSETGLASAHSAGVPCLTVESALTPQHNLEKSSKHCKNLTEVQHWVLNHLIA